MGRPHYRRVNRSKTPKVKLHAITGKSTFSERLVAQFIICGVIMALILVMNLIDTSATRNISDSIKNIVQDQPSPVEIKQVLVNASDTARTILGNKVNDNALDNFDPASDAWVLDEESSRNARQETLNPDDFRIDEDILKQIQAESGVQ